MEKNKKINWEEISFKIISKAAEAKMLTLEALDFAKKNKFDEAKEKIIESEKSIGVAGDAHMDVIVQEAQGVQHDFKVLFMHAEDQFLTTQTLILIVRELIALYERIK